MKKKFVTLGLALSLGVFTLGFTACENERTEGDGDEHSMPINENDPALNPDETDTTNWNDTGKSGGMMNEADPSSPGNNTQQDNMNSNGTNTNEKGTTGGSGALYEPGPTKDDFKVDYQDNKTTRDYNKGMDTKNNGVHEPNEYPSGRTGGQYANPQSTTTKSGVNTNENPGTGHSGGTGKTSGSGK